MKVREFLEEIASRFPTPIDVNRACEQLLKKKDHLTFSSLDLSIVLITLAYTSKNERAKLSFLNQENLFNTFADSSYAKYVAPDLFNSDLITIDEVKRRDDIKQEIRNNLGKYKIAKTDLEELLNYELPSGVNIKLLEINKSNLVNNLNDVQIEILGNNAYSFGLSQTRYHIINEIIITNHNQEEIRDAKLILTSNPNYVEFSDIDISLLPPKTPISFSEFDVKPNIEALSKLSEKIKGTITAKLMIGEEELVSISQEIDYFSYDTWFENVIDGSAALLVTPNDNAVKDIVALTAKELSEIHQTSTLSGYQSGDKNEVVYQLKALFNVLHDHGISYIEPPASFESFGQKVRTPHDVIVNKQGTCLDLSILFASCIELMGLNPVIVLSTGHAYAGAFLEDISFQTSTFSDASKIQSYISNEENQLILFECTVVTSGHRENFEDACELGRRNINGAISHPLTGESDPLFKVIDINRARYSGYLPLPIAYDEIGRISIDYEVLEQNKNRLIKKDFNHKGEAITLTDAEIDKFDLWEKKLLDLTKRNQLIKFKIQGQGLQVNYYNLDELYHAFADSDKKYAVRLTSEPDVSLFDLSLPTLTEDKYEALNRSFSSYQELELIVRVEKQKNSLKYFDREIKKAFEESGSNIFYLAIGFIQYYENSRSNIPLYAPIVLIPIDLVRHSLDKYSICGRNETPFLNISIFEYFHQEFKINFDDLLTKDKDFFSDVNLQIEDILNTVSEKLKKLDRSSVIHSAAINIFNFSKAVMWSDMKYRRDDLIQNKIVKSIIDKSYIVGEGEDIESTFDDDKSDPTDLAIPLPADSSQITAIKDCALGKSFILQGPPGTGKSQTITNMIVNAIYHGKTVLFVAEKMAALNVVRKRLDDLQLGTFALEAHSTKSNKASLMEQFKARLDLNRTASDTAEFLRKAEKLKYERTELNKVIKLLHEQNGYFLSFYDALVGHLDLDDIKEVFELSDDYVTSLNKQKFEDATVLAQRLNHAIKEANGYKNNPFILYRNERYIPTSSRFILESYLKKYEAVLTPFIEALPKFNDENNLVIDEVRESCTALVELLKTPNLAEQYLIDYIDSDYSKIDPVLQTLTDLVSEYNQTIANTRQIFNDEVLAIDAAALRAKYVDLNSSNIFKRLIGQNRIIKLLKGYAKDSSKISRRMALNHLKLITEASKARQELEKNLKIHDYLLHFGQINIDDFDFETFKSKYEFTKEITLTFKHLFDEGTFKIIIEKLQSGSLFKANELIKAYENLSAFENSDESKSLIDLDYQAKYDITYSDLLSLLKGMKSNLDNLAAWCNLIACFNRCKEHHMDDLIKFVETKDKIIEDLNLTYRKSVYVHIMQYSLTKDPDVSFNAIDLKEHVKRYQDLIEEYTKLTIEETAARASSKLPLINDNSPTSSQHGILNRAIKNKCRGKSIRQLFEEIPGILTKVFPVFLMSPMSCAQYLSPKMPKFDIVIFDEASQMPTSEAIGAITRGNSLIVVGDSMQMPPTSFFQSKGGDDTDVDIEDLDSILDDCDAIRMPSRRLNWHYRSKHESLIRFSNAQYYDNKLITFPSPNDMERKVTFVNTKGVYGGKRAINPIEGKAIIKEVERRLRDPELSKRSIGIVTFSSVQQEVIEDLLQAFFATHKDLEKISLESKEPIIVKNLENIQGDERDVILFSICYGPDAKSRMYYRFGPINNQGGEKRLNVAVSRARYEMIVYASFEPEELGKMKTDSVGAKGLYKFLRYAKYGPDSLAIPYDKAITTNVGFEKHLAQQLREKGYEVNIDVGKSTFRVDIAVVNPENKNEYILGILCDSYSYQSAQTARDRNIAQPTALKQLGWNLMRVWSFDYFDNPKRIVEEICDKIEEIKSNPYPFEGFTEDNLISKINFKSIAPNFVDYGKPYEKYYPSLYTVGAFTIERISQIVDDLVEIEAPIKESLFFKRLKEIIGSSNRITRDEIGNILINLGARVSYNDPEERYERFIWSFGKNPSQLTYYRFIQDSPRNFGDIAKEEIFIAIKEALTNYETLLISDLLAYVIKAFRVKRVTENIRQCVKRAIRWGIGKKMIVEIQGTGKIRLADRK